MFIKIVDQCTFVAVVGSCLYVIKKEQFENSEKAIVAGVLLQILLFMAVVVVFYPGKAP